MLLIDPFSPPAGCTDQETCYIRTVLGRRRALRTYAILPPLRPATMMVMGYFRAPKFSSSTKKGRGRKKDKRAAAAHEEAGLREKLLEQQPGSPGGGGVPKGYFAVYVGEEARRFVVPTGYLREPAFQDLMERAADEFGFAQAGGLRVPCAEEDFEELVRRLQRKNGGAAKGKKKAIS